MSAIFRIMRRVRPAAIIAIFLILPILQMPATPRGPAYQEATHTGQPLQYEVSVILKLIHVYVTDKKGKPVQGLTKGDFVLYDNGRPMVITDFETHNLGPLPPRAEPATTVVETPTAAPRPSSETNRKFFLFFDFAYNNARGIAKARDAALHFLANDLLPDDEVAVLTFSGIKGVAVHEYLTADREKVRKVLEAIGHKNIAGRATEIEDSYWRLVQDLPGSGPAEAMGINFLSEANASRDESKSMALKYLLQMTTLAKALRLIPGQKQFLFFSTGIPNSLIYGYTPGNARYRGGDTIGDSRLRERNEQMYKEFSAAGCSFYAFDTRESAMMTSLFTYDEQTFATGSRGMSVAIDPTNIFKDDRATGLNSLKRLTNITGGKYYSNINMYDKNLSEVQNLTGTYYVLGYGIGEKWDGEFHEIKVEVKKKGCEVRAQAGYFNPKPYREYTNLEKQLHLFDLALNERALSRLPVNFSMTALAYASAKESGLEMIAKIPSEILGKFSGKRVELVAIVFDEQDNVRDIRRSEAEPGRYGKKALAFMTGGALEPGDYRCRLVVRDMDTGMSAVASARGNIRQAQSSGLRLQTPLLLAEESGPAFLEGTSGKMSSNPAWADLYPFDRTRFSPIAGDAPPAAEKVLAVVPCTIAGDVPPDLGVAAYLIHAASGEKVPVPISLVDKTLKESLAIFSLEFPLGGLAPASYLLYVYTESSELMTLAHIQTSLVIPKR